VLCLTEHHLNYNDVGCINIEHYKFDAPYCRKNLTFGGSCIFVQEKLKFFNVNLSVFCKDKDLEVCTVRLTFLHSNICVLSIYRSPCGNFAYFLEGLDTILKICMILNWN
jgi:hypothetical protein